jgi:hypothetical protein
VGHQRAKKVDQTTVQINNPLSFMPLPTDWKPALSLTEIPTFVFSLRGALLGVVSLLFTSMLVMFFIMNIRLPDPYASGVTARQFLPF